MTEATYRRKALPHLLQDFSRFCAYCLDPNDFRSPSQDQVDHFNCKLTGRKRHQYKNLMLACAACNLAKHDKPTVNHLDKRQRLLNCTEENEFDAHIREGSDGHWIPLTKAGEYHLSAIGLDEEFHRKKRAARRDIAEQIAKLFTTAVHYQTHNPQETNAQLFEIAKLLLAKLDHFPPLIASNGTITVRQWLAQKGVDLDIY